MLRELLEATILSFVVKLPVSFCIWHIAFWGSGLVCQQTKFHSNANENQMDLAKHQNAFVSFSSDSLIPHSRDHSCRLNGFGSRECFCCKIEPLFILILKTSRRLEVISIDKSKSHLWDALCALQSFSATPLVLSILKNEIQKEKGKESILQRHMLRWCWSCPDQQVKISESISDVNDAPHVGSV